MFCWKSSLLCIVLAGTAVFLYPERAFLQPVPAIDDEHLQKGIENLQQENYEEAIEDFTRARENDIDSPVAAYYLGIAYKKAQNFREAKEHLRDAVTLHPPVKEAIIELADTLYELGEIENALSEVERAEKEGVAPANTAFLRGLILLKSKKNLEAIEAFKTAKSLDEKLASSADYQIGVAYLQAGQLNEAREIFKDIVSREPDTDIGHLSNQYIDTIAKRLKQEKLLSLTANIYYQYDSNVVLKPSDAATAAGITGESDSSTVITLRADYDKKMRAPYSMKMRYSLYLNNHLKLASHDVQSHTISLTPKYSLANDQIVFLAGYTYTLVDDDKYLETTTLSPSYVMALQKNQFARFFLQYRRKEFLQPPPSPDEDRDSNDYSIGVSWFYFIVGESGFLNARYEINKEEAQGQNWGYTGNKAGLSLVYPLREKLSLTMAGEAYFQNYHETHTAFGIKRKDTTYTAFAMISYILRERIAIQVQYTDIREDSNIGTYDYDRFIISSGVEVRY